MQDIQRLLPLEGLVPGLLERTAQEVRMLKIVLEVDAPTMDAQGAKEAIAADLEKYGDVRVVQVQEVHPKQMEVWT